jgi:hypothetical protein
MRIEQSHGIDNPGGKRAHNASFTIRESGGIYSISGTGGAENVSVSGKIITITSRQGEVSTTMRLSPAGKGVLEGTWRLDDYDPDGYSWAAGSVRATRQ